MEAGNFTDKQLEKLDGLAKRMGITLQDAMDIYGSDVLRTVPKKAIEYRGHLYKVN